MFILMSSQSPTRNRDSIKAPGLVSTELPKMSESGLGWGLRPRPPTVLSPPPKLGSYNYGEKAGLQTGCMIESCAHLKVFDYAILDYPAECFT